MDYLNTTEYRIKPISALKIIRNCAGCGKKSVFASTGQFRINANGNLVDVWLIYRCEKCKHTFNFSVYERMKAERLPKEQYMSFLRNEEDMALKIGNDLNLFRENKVEIDADQLEYICEKLDCDYENTGAGRGKIIIHNPFKMKIRTDKLLPELLGMSRNQVKKLLKEDKIRFAGSYPGDMTEIFLDFPFS